MKKLNICLFLAFAIVSLYSCEEEKICTMCTDAGTGVTTSFCDTEIEVGLFENEIINQGNAAGQSWSCIR